MTNPPLDSAIFLVVTVLAIVVLWRFAWFLVRHGLQAAHRLPGTAAGRQAWARIHPLRAATARQFPRVYAHFARRLDPHGFSGLPLTLTVVAAAYLAALFGGLVEELGEAEELARFDSRIDALVGPWRTTLLVDLFAWITALGGTAALTAAALVATGFLWAHRRRHVILPLWVNIVGSQATTYIGKFGFGRERPDFVTEATAVSPSFPSGHTTGAMAVYGFLAYAIVRDLVHPRQRFEVTFWTAILIALIGFSRVFLSVHYASDVAAGFLVGGFWLLVGFAIAEYLRQRTQDVGGP
ncbi:phosphatase PAP2 family protein [Rhodospirillaceae bacterium SYSU D60014]|uniref:phosphatase PAP2 family protein n=1 Tax=Virgifigura deserti TaxID=2268457 RepID=UPI0013C43BAF